MDGSFSGTAGGLFRLAASPMIAITGGGKTSLMFALAGLLGKEGRAVATTTAKIAVPAGELFVGGLGEAAERIAAMPRRGVMAAAAERRGAKLYGFPAAGLCSLLKKGVADWIIVEADGSRGLPLKAYEEWEPPVPELATLHLVIVGAEAFLEPLSGELAFRAELLEQRYGASCGEKIPARRLALILSDEKGYLKNSPPQARRVLLINKADLMEAKEARSCAW